MKMKTDHYSEKAFRLLSISIWFLLGSCTTKLTPEDPISLKTPTPETDTSTLPRQDPIPSTDISYLPTKRANATLLPPNITTATIIQSLTATSTPEPTLIPEDSQKLLMILLQTNGGCKFPCVWGITPGGSSFEDMQKFVARIGTNNLERFETEAVTFEEVSAIFYNFRNEEKNIDLSFSFESIGKPIRYLLFTAMERVGQSDNRLNPVIGYFGLSTVLTNFGRPSEVFIGPWPDEPHLPNTWLPFGVVLYYPEQGFLAQYLLHREKDENYFIGCTIPVMQFFLTTWDEKQETTLEEAASVVSVLGAFRSDDGYFQPINQAMDMTVDEFYSTYSNATTQPCLKAPRSNWEYGYMITVTPSP